jgi:hypothetical protein
MTKVMRLILSAFAAISVVLLGSALPAAAATIYNQRTPIETNVSISCPEGGAGEFIHLTGSLHQLVNQTTDANGGLHFVVLTTLAGLQGTDSSGVKYVFNLENPFNQQFNAPKGAAYESTSTSPIVLVRQGSTSGGDNLNLQYVSRITVDANGEIATVQNRFSTKCVG